MLTHQDTTGRDEGLATHVLVADGLLGTRLHLWEGKNKADGDLVLRRRLHGQPTTQPARPGRYRNSPIHGQRQIRSLAFSSASFPACSD